MIATELPVESRERTGKEAVQKLRQTGRIPAILYGAGGTPRALTVVEAEFQKALRQHGQRLSLLTLKIGSESEMAVLKAIQRNPVHERIDHIDFLRIAMDKKLSIEIPIHIEGVAAGVKFGGVLQQMARHVRVNCMPTDIPEQAVADVSKLEIGHVLTAAHLQLPPNVTLETPAGDPIVSVTVTKYEEEAAAATPGAEGAAATAAAEPAQPEVIGEKEREERKLKKEEEKGGKQKEKAELKEIKAKEEKKK